jgi:hypothetical protein
MRRLALVLVVMTASLWIAIGPVDSFAYPPAVGILGKATNCLSCHVSNGPWKDDDKTIIDILDKDTQRSLRRPDNSFLIEVKRGQVRTVLTVLGVRRAAEIEPPYRNAWLYVDPRTIGSSSLSKFAPGWEVNLPMSCRIAGDPLEGYAEARISVLPMSLRPSDAAQDAEIVLQVMLTRGESVKGSAKEGLLGSYFERKVTLKVSE